MPVDVMFILATLAFAWGLSLTTYRWFAVHNGWPMGEWQAHRPGLPIAIGLFAMAFAVLFAMLRGGATLLIVPLFGVLCALAWTAITRIGAQSALLLAPLAVLALLGMWYAAATHMELDLRRPANNRGGDRPLERQVVPPSAPQTLPSAGAPTVAPISGRPVDRPLERQPMAGERPTVLPALPGERAPTLTDIIRGIATDRQPAPLPPPTSTR